MSDVVISLTQEQLWEALEGLSKEDKKRVLLKIIDIGRKMVETA